MVIVCWSHLFKWLGQKTEQEAEKIRRKVLEITEEHHLMEAIQNVQQAPIQNAALLHLCLLEQHLWNQEKSGNVIL